MQFAFSENLGYKGLFGGWIHLFITTGKEMRTVAREGYSGTPAAAAAL